MCPVQLSAFYIEYIASLNITLEEQDPFSASCRNLNVSYDAMRAVENLDGCICGNRLSSGITGELVRSAEKIGGHSSTKRRVPRESMGSTLYFPASGYQVEIISISLGDYLQPNCRKMRFHLLSEEFRYYWPFICCFTAKLPPL